MTDDMSPAWLIENTKASLFPGEIDGGRGGNGSLLRRHPREARNPLDDDDGAPSKDGQIEFDIAFDVNNFLILITLAIALTTYLTLTVLLLVKRWWGGRMPLYILKWPPSSIKSTNPYVVTIVTGSKKDAGTDGTLVFSIHGLNSTSDQCFINGGMVHRGHMLLSQGGSDAFLITCDEPLGNIAEASITLWAMDPYEKWYLRYITIQDIKRNVFTYLPLHKWVYATKAVGEELIIQARNKTFNQFLDNIICAFRERDVWIAPWLSTILGSKLGSVFSITLCYLTITCFMFAAVLLFYTPAYEQHDYMTAGTFVFALIAAVVITCCVTLLHTAMRLIRLGTGDFVDRYSPVLLRDLSASPHVHWNLDSDRMDSDSSGGWRESRSDGPSGKRQRRLTGSDANAQWNNSNSMSFGGPWGERKRLTLSSQDRVLAGRQSNNNNRSGTGSSKGDIFQAFQSSCFRMMDDSKSSFVTDGDDATVIRDNFTKTRFPAGSFSSSSKSPTGISSLGRSTAPGSSFHYRPRTANPVGSCRSLSRSNSGFGLSKSPATSIKASSRRYDSYLNVPDNGTTSAWPSFPPQRSSCLKNTNSDCECPLFAQGLSMSTGAAPTTRSVAFKYPLDDDDSCSKYFAKTSNSDTNRTLFGFSLPQSDNWKIPSAPAANDTRFSSRRFGPSSRIKSNAREDAKTFRSRCAYDDVSWGLDDTSQTQDYVERSLSQGVASTKKFSFPKQNDGVATDNFGGGSRAASDPCYGRTPVISPSLQKAIARMANESLQTDENVDQDIANLKNANILPCDCPVQEGDRNQADEVERSWNALWNHVKPQDDNYGASKDGSSATDGSKTAPEVNGKVMAELRGFAGKLVESIISKIKKQLTSPDQCVDLADCEFDIESFVRRMSQRMTTAGVTDFDCGAGYKSDFDDPCASRFPDCSAGSDLLTDRITQTVTDGALKTSLAMLDERVAAIVKDVEKVRGNIMERMRQELGLGPEDDGKDFTGRHLGMSASDTSVTMMTKGKTDKFGTSYIPSDNISSTMTDAKLAKVARSSLENVLNREGMDNARDSSKATAEGDLKNFATDVVQSLYMAVRTKLQQMLKHEYDLADDGTVPFPTEELLKKADHEVQEQVLPTVVEHIVWLMKEEAKVMGQLDCDMMMIAFAGQYVDTIVTNAVLKTHVDLTRKRAYTRTFVVTSNSNKTNSNNNHLSSMLDRCISERTLSMRTLASLSATRLEVEEVLRDSSSYEHVEAELAQLQILCSLVYKFIARLRGVRQTATRPETVPRMGDADLEEAKEEEACPYCRAEAARRVVARCLTPISAKLITDLILEEATKNLDACGRIVESNLARCNQETMVALGRALLDGSSESGDHLLILESVTADLKAMALDRATAKVVDDLMAIGDASRAEAEKELRRKLDGFMDHARKNTEKMMMKTAIRENHQQNNSHFQIDFYPHSENINYNAAAAAAAAEVDDGGRSPAATGDAGQGKGIAEGKGGQDSNALETEDSDDNPDNNHPDADNVVDEMIGIRNSLTRIADEDECLTGRCRRHRGRLSRTLRSSRCENLHYGDFEFNDEESRTTKPSLTETLADIEGCTLSDLWADPTGFRHRCLVFFGRLVFAFVLVLVASFVIGCVVFGLRLTPSQAGLWLQLAGVGTAMHVLLFEPIKIFALAIYWTVFRNDLMQ